MSFHQYAAQGRGQLPARTSNERINAPELYLPGPDLVDAVNVAITLGQPLLLTGAPGTGKTQLAHHIAWFFELGKPLVFNAQTTSSVRDVFYSYDALAHFQYSQTSGETLTPDAVEERFIRYQALGRAIRDKRAAVVLIDEIDKAPRDLPNDVLAALENLEFSVPEVNKSYRSEAETRPIIVMTSNSEKNLPDAFLRRVTYYDIPFPDDETLLTILQSKTEDFGKDELQAVIQHFMAIHQGKRVRLKKEPATAELIYWTLLLRDLKFPVRKLVDSAQLDEDEKRLLGVSYSVLAKTREDLAALKSKL